jgi:hypothetical protein
LKFKTKKPEEERFRFLSFSCFYLSFEEGDKQMVFNYGGQLYLKGSNLRLGINFTPWEGPTLFLVTIFIYVEGQISTQEAKLKTGLRFFGVDHVLTLKKPPTPSSRAPSMGLVATPVTPSKMPMTRPFPPRAKLSPKFCRPRFLMPSRRLLWNFSSKVSDA